AFTSSPGPSEHQLALLSLLLRHGSTAGESTRLLSEACRRQPRNFWVHREMGFALAVQGRFLEAAGYYRVALSLRPDNAGTHEALGMALASAGQLDDAIAAYRQAVTAAPKNRPLRARLVEALANAGYWKEAEAECRLALEIDSRNHFAPHSLAGAL